MEDKKFLANSFLIKVLKTKNKDDNGNYIHNIILWVNNCSYLSYLNTDRDAELDDVIEKLKLYGISIGLETIFSIYILENIASNKKINDIPPIDMTLFSLLKRDDINVINISWSRNEEL